METPGGSGKKIDRILQDDALLDKTPLNVLAISGAVHVDKAEVLAGRVPSPPSSPKITLEDAQRAIEEARRKVEQDRGGK